jgi:hypothetical protein
MQKNGQVDDLELGTLQLKGNGNSQTHNKVMQDESVSTINGGISKNEIIKVL